jgi:hypothetical protein
MASLLQIITDYGIKEQANDLAEVRFGHYKIAA